MMEKQIKNLKNAKIVITGATGLIGSNLIYYLSTINKQYDLKLTIYALCRNFDKFLSFNFEQNIKFVKYALGQKIELNENIDYVIHTASPTSSKYFITNPVETINDTYFGLKQLLDYSIGKDLKAFIYLSSLEVYGICNEDKYLKEDEYYPIDIFNVRNSYSEGKRMLELLCNSYNSEYGVPTRILRLGQCFGGKINQSDERVFAYFLFCYLNNKNIVLSTQGLTKRSYLSLRDCINGIIVCMLNGENGESYNLASDNSYISINELANLFVANSNLDVEYNIKNDNKYLQTIRFALDTAKIKKIGFKSVSNVEDMVRELIYENSK